MAGSALLEREIEKITGETEVSDEVQERERIENEEAYAHRQKMAENLRDIIERRVDFADSRSESDYEPQNVYQYSDFGVGDHSPVVPTAQIAPGASERINDYLAANRSLEEMRSRSGERYQSPQEGVFERALARVLASEYASPVEEYEEYEPSEEEELYEQGIFMNADFKPERERVQMPSYSPSYMAAPVVTEESDDALPTPKTLESIREKPIENKREESEERIPQGLSAKTKVILAALAATIAILIAIISINTAVLNSVRASIREREGTLTELSETLSGIETEIGDLTSFENVENWANSHGMTPPNP